MPKKMLLSDNFKYYASSARELQKMEKYGHRVSKFDYVYCYYLPKYRKNVLADSMQQVSKFFQISQESDSIKMSVCEIRNIDIDLTGNDLKKKVLNDEKI